MKSLFKAGHAGLALAEKFQWLALFVARLTVGLEFVSTGWGKVHNLAKIAGFFGELGIPAPAFNATLASFIELICGGLLVLGLASRLAACPLVVTMVVAIVTAKRDDIHNLFDVVGLVEWTYIAILGVIVLLGPGKVSLDTLVSKKLGWPKPA